MLEAGDEPDFPNEPDLTGLGLRISGQNLDRYLTLVLEVAREVHRRVRALADLAPDLVMTAKRYPKRRDRIGEGRRGVLSTDLSHRHGRVCSRTSRRGMHSATRQP
jgi:hypothetical protein